MVGENIGFGFVRAVVPAISVFYRTRLINWLIACLMDSIFKVYGFRSRLAVSGHRGYSIASQARWWYVNSVVTKQGLSRLSKGAIYLHN
jgi:hypothetical protein